MESRKIKATYVYCAHLLADATSCVTDSLTALFANNPRSVPLTHLKLTRVFSFIPLCHTPDDAYPLLILRQAMAGVVTISVDGQDGELVARSNGLYAASPDSDFALVKVFARPSLTCHLRKIDAIREGTHATYPILDAHCGNDCYLTMCLYF